MSDQYHRVADWMHVVRRIRFGKARDGVSGQMIKSVASMLASYGTYSDGTRVRPGTARIAVDCEISYKRAKACIAILRDLGLIRLVRKASRRGEADEYRLDLPEDLLDRMEIDVLDPGRYESEIARVRAENRGKYIPEDLRGTERPAETDLRGTPLPAETPTAPTPAGNSTTRRRPSAGKSVSNLRGRLDPPTYQSTSQGLPTSGDVSADVAVPRANPTDSQDPISQPVDITTRRRCPHGRTTRLRPDNTPRCTDCRNEQGVTTPPANEPVTTPALTPEQEAAAITAAKAKLTPPGCPTHGPAFEAGTRPDGQPVCPLCRALSRKDPT